MGYFVKGKEIADLNPKAMHVSLSANPNFVQFESKIDLMSGQPLHVVFQVGTGKAYEIVDSPDPTASDNVYELERDDTLSMLLDYIAISNNRINPYTAIFKDKNTGKYYKFVNYTRFSICDVSTGTDRWFQGIDPIMAASGAYETSDYTFYLSDDPVQTAQNLREALMQCPFIRDNFKVSMPITSTVDQFVEIGTSIELLSLGIGKRYKFKVNPDNKSDEEKFRSFLSITYANTGSDSPDTINEGIDACEIQLDVYTDTALFLGEADKPDVDNLGVYLTTLSKTYFNEPVWFDVNSIQSKEYKAPFGTIGEGSELRKSDPGVWFDPGTYSNRRFVAKRITSSKSESFYYSPVLYTLTGYDRNLDTTGLDKYIFDVRATLDVNPDKWVRPLTLQPALSHVRGQIQYFNFILRDRSHSTNTEDIGLHYELLTQSGVLLVEEIEHKTKCFTLGVVNTIALNIDHYIDQYPTLGSVRVSLTRGDEKVSRPLIFNILPSHLYQVHDFVFLNSLGGWSSFNFGDQDQIDFKTTATNYFRNQTPSSNISSTIETVYRRTIEEKFIVRTQPIPLATAEWLKEISTSIAVYERSTCRYVVVDELNIKYTSQDSFVRLEMKYHYSDSYNADLK